MGSKADRINKTLNHLNTKIQKIMGLRIILGAALVIVFFTMSMWKAHLVLVSVFLVMLVSFLYLVRQMKKIKTLHAHLTNYSEFLERQKMRVTGNYRGPSGPLELTSEQHTISNDLGLVGEHSVFNLLDETLTNSGKEQLLQELINGLNSPEEVASRHKQVKALSKYRWELIRFRLFGRTTASHLNTKELAQILEQPIVPDNFKKLYSSHITAFVITWAFVIMAIAGHIKVNPLLPFLLYLFYSLFTRSSIEMAFSKAQKFSLDLSALSPLLSNIEDRWNKGEIKNHFKDTLAISPKKNLKKVNLLIQFLSIQGHPMVHFILNAISPWDYVFTHQLEKWRKGFSGNFPKILQEIKNFEVLSSVTFFHIYQTQNWPQISSETVLKMEGGFHPLISRNDSVANNFTLSEKSNLVLITGSNMSGKSTFLRTIGINQVLARMGAPVFAKSFSTNLAPLATCMKVQDSLEAGLSTFYYEVKQVAHILDKARKGENFLYLIDEIFRGTNNKERLIGSKSVVHEMINFPKAMGFISTHDLELPLLSQKFPSIENWHFADDADSEQLTFDYKIRRGPCQSTNALKILANEGVKIIES